MANSRLISSNDLTTANFNLLADEWAESRGMLIGTVTAGILSVASGGTGHDNLPDVKIWLGINNVNNTSDLNKPVSTATQVALSSKFNTPTGTINQYIAGNGTIVNFPTLTNGTVTSVSLIGGTTGFIVDGGPVTTAGTMTLRGILNVSNGGTGVTSLEDLKTALHIVNDAQTATSGNITPNANLYKTYTRSALSGACTINSPVNGSEADEVVIRIRDNGTRRAVSFASDYRAVGVRLPTTTAAKTDNSPAWTYVRCLYNATDTLWDVIDVRTENVVAVMVSE